MFWLCQLVCYSSYALDPKGLQQLAIRKKAADVCLYSVIPLRALRTARLQLRCCALRTALLHIAS